MPSSPDLFDPFAAIPDAEPIHTGSGHEAKPRFIPAPEGTVPYKGLNLSNNIPQNLNLTVNDLRSRTRGEVPRDVPGEVYRQAVQALYNRINAERIAATRQAWIEPTPGNRMAAAKATRDADLLARHRFAMAFRQGAAA